MSKPVWSEARSRSAKPSVAWVWPSTSQPKLSLEPPAKPWVRYRLSVPISWVIRPANSSCGIGVDNRLMAPPMVYGPLAIAAGPFSTSMPAMRPVVGK
ncbi:hypothetical protein D3C78_867170 [compost metagenome]